MNKLLRTKNLMNTDIMDTELSRCLNYWDLLLIGIGGMLGSGLYLIMGEVVKDITGPAIIISFLLAGLAALLSAWCYAEFLYKVPRAGSAYLYSYITLGEIAAFIIGWNMVLEHVIGTAAVARGLIGYVDLLIDEQLQKACRYLFHGHDWSIFAVLIIIAFLLIVSFGVRSSTFINNVLTIFNLFVLLMFVVITLQDIDFNLWSDGKFMPNGIGSILSGAAQTYFFFVGYDSVAMASEESISPKKDAPHALMMTTILVTIIYLIVGSIYTLSTPLDKIIESAALSADLKLNDHTLAAGILTVGAVSTMATTMLSTCYSMPRSVYAIAKDGLIFKFLAKVEKHTQIPVFATVLGGVVICIFAFFFNLKELAEMMSIGSLLAYLVVSISIIIYRYLPYDPITGDTNKGILDELPETKINRVATWQTVAVIVFFIFNTLLALETVFYSKVENHTLYSLIMATTCLAMIVPLAVLHVFSPFNNQWGEYTVWFCPFLPALSVFLNTCFMLHLNYMTWVRFGGWMLMGIIIYFVYGVHNSMEALK